MQHWTKEQNRTKFQELRSPRSTIPRFLSSVLQFRAAHSAVVATESYIQRLENSQAYHHCN